MDFSEEEKEEEEDASTKRGTIFFLPRTEKERTRFKKLFSLTRQIFLPLPERKSVIAPATDGQKRSLKAVPFFSPTDRFFYSLFLTRIFFSCSKNYALHNNNDVQDESPASLLIRIIGLSTIWSAAVKLPAVFSISREQEKEILHLTHTHTHTPLSREVEKC